MTAIFDYLTDNGFRIEWHRLGDYVPKRDFANDQLIVITSPANKEKPASYQAVMPWESVNSPTIYAVAAYLATVLRDYEYTYDSGKIESTPRHIANNARAIIDSGLSYHLRAMVRIAHQHLTSYQGQKGAIWI